MTLDGKLLENLNSWRPAGLGPHTLTATAEQGRVHLEAEQVDTLAIALRIVDVMPTPRTAAPLADRAAAVAARVAGLLEPLKVIEIDGGRGEALLRSDVPAHVGNDRLYYELLLEASGRATMRRWRGSLETTGRQAVPFTLTREVIQKLVADLLA